MTRRVLTILVGALLLALAARMPITFFAVLIGVLFTCVYLALPDDTQRIPPPPPPSPYGSGGTPPPPPWERRNDNAEHDR